MNLYGSTLPSPLLRFNNSSSYAVSQKPRQGLKQFGPYDSALFDKSKVRCGLIYPDSATSLKKIFVDGISNGEEYFVGFQKQFRVPLIFEEEQSSGAESEKEVKRAITILTKKNLDLVFIINSSPKNALYQTCKSELLGNGIPSQIITEKRLQNSPSQRQWILENIALASYAKVGGTPWVVAYPPHKKQLVLGISRAQDENKKFLVGFVTLFTQDGDFLLMHSKAPVVGWDAYPAGLETLVTEAIKEYENRMGLPEEIILHFHKNPGASEVEAVKNALDSIGNNLPYALLHLNEYSNFRLFDSGHRTYLPESGLRVDISKRESLLLLDGRIGDVRRRVGVPRVLDIVMDKRSTLPFDNFHSLVKQIYDFSYVNWRGFNATAIPVTLNYSKLIAGMVAEVGAENWNQVIASGKLRDKSWFL